MIKDTLNVPMKGSVATWREDLQELVESDLSFLSSNQKLEEEELRNLLFHLRDFIRTLMKDSYVHGHRDGAKATVQDLNKLLPETDQQEFSSETDEVLAERKFQALMTS
jgi:hypothetical protein